MNRTGSFIEGPILSPLLRFTLPVLLALFLQAMYGAVDFYRACKSEGIKPIIGCEVYVAPGSRFDKEAVGSGDDRYYHLVLLAENDRGYHNLMKIVSKGFTEGYYYKPRVVRQIWDENGDLVENKNPVVLRRTVSKETSELLKDYMLGVVEEGTGKSAAVEGYDLGGKTGTAEKLPRSANNYLLSFIGYAPQENPQVMVYVIVDEPNVAKQEVCAYAIQLAADIMREVFPYLGIEKAAADAVLEAGN